MFWYEIAWLEVQGVLSEVECVFHHEGVVGWVFSAAGNYSESSILDCLKFVKVCVKDDR